MMLLKNMRAAILPLLLAVPLIGTDVMLEFKAAYFLPTGSTFKDIYPHGGALYGPELTVQCGNDTSWYVFASVDYFHKKGHSLGLCDPTTVSLVPLAFGLKYLMPICNSCWEWYLGLGFQAIDVTTKNCSQDVLVKLSQWGFGGIAKIGVWYHLPRNFILDIFIDYSFVNVGDCSTNCPTSLGAISRKANVGGAIFGAGLGYMF